MGIEGLAPGWVKREDLLADGSLVLMPMLLSKPLGVSYH